MATNVNVNTSAITQIYYRYVKLYATNKRLLTFALGSLQEDKDSSSLLSKRVVAKHYRADSAPYRPDCEQHA